jgi:hypothetical protein
LKLAGESLGFQWLKCTPRIKQAGERDNMDFSSMTLETKKGHANHTSYNHHGKLVETNDDDDTIVHVLTGHYGGSCSHISRDNKMRV